MKKILLYILISLAALRGHAQYKPARITESSKVFTTYEFSDPDPIPDVGKFYPYFRFDGYTNTPTRKEWKIVELENDFIKVMILPEIGGKIWGAWEKATGRPFIYYNQVVKFRDVAMRGPWTSGGIEANYGIIGHTPNCATPMDYLTQSNPDGSVSCFIGTLDLLTQTYWTIEINVPKDKAYFTTRSFWNNATSIEQPYYTWMNAGMPAAGNLEFIYPGTQYIGHNGEHADWNISADNNKDLSFYDNNNFGGPKSYHVLGKYSDFFAAFYHDHDFGMARYSLRDEKPGRKIWIWGLSRQGMIWEKLLTDNDGQYVEVQSGRLFNQASDGSNLTPFKQLGFAPHTTDEWTEYWFPVKGTKGLVKANQFAALNVRFAPSMVKIDIMPLQNMQEELKIFDGGRVLHSRVVNLKTLKGFSDSVTFTGNAKDLVVTLGNTKLRYAADPADGVLGRPVESPPDVDENTASGLYTLGKEFLQQRYYALAESKLKDALEKDPHYLPALADLAMIRYRNLDFTKALEYATHALRIDTYDPAANYYYGLANAKSGNIDDAKDGLEIASLSPSYRGTAYTELSKLYFRESDLEKSLHYARRAIGLNQGNVTAWQIIATAARKDRNPEMAKEAMAALYELSPLNHFVRFEKYQWEKSELNKESFTGLIRNELRYETFLDLADHYSSLGQYEDATDVLALAPERPETFYRMAWLNDRIKPGSGLKLIEKANAISPEFVFPFRESTAEALSWVALHTNDWKPRYYLGLIYWSREDRARAKKLFADCGNPNFAPFYAARALLSDIGQRTGDLRHASALDPQQWRYGRLLAEHLIDLGRYPEALAVATDYARRFNNDFRLGMLLARTMILNKRYRDATDLLGKITILPYEGATDGRQMYREAWLMQAAERLQRGDLRAATAAIGKAKEWPENLGAGKPYDDMIDLRLELFMEGLVSEKNNRTAEARDKFLAAAHDFSAHHNINDLVSALALKKLGKKEEGRQLIDSWLSTEPDSALAEWAGAVYRGSDPTKEVDGNDDFRIIRAILPLLKT